MTTTESSGPSEVIAAVWDILPGHWEITRTIPGQGSFVGWAEIDPVNEGVLDYREEGVTQQDNGTSFRGSRRFQFRREDETLGIFFDDGLSHGQLFLRLKLESTGDTFWPVTAQDVHPCREDLHLARYEFISSNQFTVTYHVTGPGQDYLVHSSFSKRTAGRL